MTIAESKIQMAQKDRARRERLKVHFFDRHKGLSLSPDEAGEKLFEAFLEGYAYGTRESEMDAEVLDVGFYEEDFH